MILAAKGFFGSVMVMIVVAMALLGLACGSFVNALVWRLRQQEKVKRKSALRNSRAGRLKGQKPESGRYSILRGRSMCPHCEHELAWYDLLPVVSWLLLRGKCRYCGKHISWQYPLVEIVTALLFVWSYLAWPSLLLFSLWLVFLTGFIALTVYDLKWMELPNRIVYPLIGLAGFQVIVLMVAGRGMWLDELTDAFWGLLTIGGLFYALFQVSGGRWIGGGDVKLGFVIGLLVGGPLASVAVIFLASLLGTIVSLPLLVSKSVKANSRIPFGPFLMTATFLVYLYGERLTDLYWDLFL